MLRRPRRPPRFPRAAALAASIVVLPSVLAACGSDTGEGNGLQFANRLDAVTIEGDVGEAPTIEWTARMQAKAAESETLVEGDGAPLAEGDQVFVNFVLGDGFTRETPIDTFGETAPGVRLTVGGDPVQPSSEETLVTDLLQSFLLEQVEAGVTRGSRIVVTGDAEAVFGTDYVASPSLAAINVGNQDSLLVVADVLDDEQLDGPAGTEQDPPSWAPEIKQGTSGKAKGLPAALVFDDTPEPTDKLRTAVLTEGTGDPVEKGDLMVADYLGQVYKGAKPFDESFTKEPYPTPIGLGAVVKGWDQALVGVPVGSRVLLQIPPRLGYGKKGSGETIPGGSTLYFVIDVLASI